MRRIRLFLGGYVNYLNAQNINCRALSEVLDKGRFEISTMLYPEQTAGDFAPRHGVRYLRIHRPVRLWRYVIYLLGIARADVAYLPKGEIDGFCLAVAQAFRTKVFSTVELIYPNELSEKNRAIFEKYRKFEPNLYSITNFISTELSGTYGLKFAERVLYLGTNSDNFAIPGKRHKPLQDIIFIGNDLERKNISDFMEAAKTFPGIRFHIVGGNQLCGVTVENYIAEHNLANVTYQGRLDHMALAELLGRMDLMYFPSRSEGFPKVHLEAASAGVPTLCYSDYGAGEWIETERNGLVVNTSEEARREISRLRENPDALRKLSEGAVELGKKFDWKNMAPLWAEEIERIANSK